MLFTMRETYVNRNPKMALHAQNINHSAFKSMFEREKLSGTNFNDWIRRLKLVLRVKKKMFFIEQPITPAPAADFEANVFAEWNAELKSMFEKQAEVKMFDLIQTLHACKQEESKSVGAYVLKMKDYVEHLERIGYVLPHDLSVGLILNGLASDFARFVRNYNMHNMGKTIGEIHDLLIEYEKDKGKGKANGKGKDKQVYIPKPKKPKPSAKEHPAKDDTCHHYKEVGHWEMNCPVYLAELLKKKKQDGIATSSRIFTIELFAFFNKSWVYDTDWGTRICITKQRFREARNLKQGALYLYVGNGVRAQVEAIISFDFVLPNGLVIYLDNCHYAHFITRGVVSVHRLMTRKSFPRRPKRAIDLLGIIHIDVCGTLRHVSRQGDSYLITFTGDYSRYGYVYLLKHKHELSFWDCAIEYATRILNMVPTKKVDKTPYELWYEKVPNLSYLKETMGYYFYFSPENKIVVARYAEFFEKSLITQEVSERAIDFEEIQAEDTSPSEITGKIPMEVEGFKPPQKEVIPVSRSERTHRAPTRLCLNVEAKEDSLGDLNEPTSYEAAMLDPESNKWLDAMNA
nr:hypothetical protein [Tanacetum cinerariifolium]